MIKNNCYVCAALVLFFSTGIFQAGAATWNGVGLDTQWTNTLNWSGSPATWPGQSGDAETSVSIGGGKTAVLNGDITQGALTVISIGQSSVMRVEAGAALPNVNLWLDPWAPSGTGATFEMNGGVWSNRSGIFIGRWDAGPTNAVATFVMSGGIYSNTFSGSGGRVENGSGNNQGLSLAQFTGGEFWMASFWNMQGNTNGHSRLELSGGRFRAGTLYAGSLDASDGYQAEIKVIESGAERIEAASMNIYRHADNATGRSRVTFVADENGVTPMIAGTLNLGATPGRQGSLEVDLSNYHPGTAGDTLVLFEYTSLSGTFGDTNVLLGDNVLSYELDYVCEGNKIALVNMTHTPLQVATRPVKAVTDTRADLVAEVTYVDPGGAALWIYYGTNDGLDAAGNWETNVLVGTGVPTGVYTGMATDLAADRQYHYRAYAGHGATSVWADSSQTFGTRFLTGMAPTNITALGGWDRVDLSWSESFNTEVGFVVERATNAVFSGDLTRLFLPGNSATGWVDTTPFTGMSSYYRIAATNAGGLSAWSDEVSAVATASVVTIAEVTLSARSVFDLQAETRKRALRGTREATISASIAGIDVDLAIGNPLYDYGAPTNSSWYIDPWGTSLDVTEFRETFTIPFDFGNGVTTNLPIVPVYMHKSDYSSWNNLILLNLAYTGEIVINGTNYIIEVVQGASPEFKDRLSYPGYFNDPAVNVLLYEASTTNLVEGLARVKRLGGVWYAFESNPSGEQMAVRRIDGVGTMTVDAGPFFTNDFAFYNCSFLTTNGWQLDMEALDFSDGSEVIPAADYVFTELSISNAGKRYTLLWHGSFAEDHGEMQLLPGENKNFAVGKSWYAEVLPSVNFADYRNTLYTLYEQEQMDFRVRDADLGAAVRQLDDQCGVLSYQNSNGDEIETIWKTYGCGWDGRWIFYTDYRDYLPSGKLIMGTDTNPPAVYDTRTITFQCNMAGLYGSVSTSVTINVKNEHYGLHAKFYDFDEHLTGFPDLDNRFPDLETGDGRMSAAAVTEPWQGLPPEMADTFAAVYTFEFYSATFGSGPASLTFKLTAQGAARVYINDQLVVENISPNALTTASNAAPVQLALNTLHRARIEYFHNAGAAALTLSASGIVPPYYGVNLQFDPDVNGHRTINPVMVPATLSVTGPVESMYTSPADFTVSAVVSHPDGVGAFEVYVDGVKRVVVTNAPYTAPLARLPVNAEVSVRAVDMFGYGVSSNLNLIIERETLQNWLDRHTIVDPDGDEDQDGISNRDEFTADTGPTNAASAFVITDVVPCGLSNCVSWTGTKNDLVLDHYEVEVSPLLSAASPTGGWALVTSRVPLNLTGSNRWWHVVEDASNVYYRVRAVSR